MKREFVNMEHEEARDTSVTVLEPLNRPREKLQIHPARAYLFLTKNRK